MNPFDWLYCIGLAVVLAVSQIPHCQIVELRPLDSEMSAGALLAEAQSK